MHQLTRGIVIDPAVRFGKPTLRGTRITVDEALGFLAAGMDYHDIRTEYGLTRPQLQAALRYANTLLKGEEVAALRA